MAKPQMDIKSINVGFAVISLPPDARGREWGKLAIRVNGYILPVPCAVVQAFCIMITNIIQTFAVVTKLAIILFLFLKLILLRKPQ